MCIKCSLMVSNGDMSPRMWICQDTKKPTTGFIGTMNAIDYGIKKYNLDTDSAYQEAYDFLKHQREINQGIYFCEDYFSQDLKEYWDNKYQKQKLNEIEVIIDDTEEKITTEKKQSFKKLLKEKIMKKIITLIAFLAILIINAQYTHSFEGYDRESPDEIQFTFIPLSISNDQEVNQFELGWRRGAHGASIRYGIDNSRTNYYDLSTNVYFWITKHVDLTLGAGFGTRTNVKFEVKNSTDKFYIPYNFGIILKPSNNFQIITRVEKIDNEHDWYFQTGMLIKIPLN